MNIDDLLETVGAKMIGSTYQPKTNSVTHTISCQGGRVTREMSADEFKLWLSTLASLHTLEISTRMPLETDNQTRGNN